MKNTFWLIFVLSIIWLAGCKQSDTNVIESNLPQLTVDSTKGLAVNDISVTMDKYGALFTPVVSSGTTQGKFIFIAGLWIATEQDGEIRGNVVSGGTSVSKKSNYAAYYNKKQYGVYRVDESLKYLPANWPVSLGAPVTYSGYPLVYGDAMCWAALYSDTNITTSPLLTKPLKGLRVCEAIYGYGQSDLRYVFFIRYAITNTTTRKWDNVYVGFYSDTDVNGGSYNKTGYDSAKSICYTYTTNSYYTTGFTFLESPNNLGITSSRIMRKAINFEPNFDEYIRSPQQILFALQGLSKIGDPMINPVTGQITKFAFTGDPIAGTGWLDYALDTRNIISSGPFTLNAGETTTVTVVWVSTSGINLADAITQMKDKIDYVRQNSSLWQF